MVYEKMVSKIKKISDKKKKSLDRRGIFGIGRKRFLQLAVFDAIAITLIALLVNGNIPMYPMSNMHTTNRHVAFEWTGLASKVLIDDNPQFTSPKEATKNGLILEPGTYYWRAEGISPVRKFTIDSEVAIEKEERIGERSANYTIKNAGNTETFLEILKRGIITGRIILGLGEKTDVELNETAEMRASQR